jgi:hypothetical protein
LTHYVTSRKVTDSIPDEIIGFFFFNLPNLSSRNMAMGVDSACTRNEYQQDFWGLKGGRRVKADNLAAIYELTV